MSEKLKRKDYEISTLKRQLNEQRCELEEARRQLRRAGKDDDLITVLRPTPLILDSTQTLQTRETFHKHVVHQREISFTTAPLFTIN